MRRENGQPPERTQVEYQRPVIARSRGCVRAAQFSVISQALSSPPPLVGADSQQHSHTTAPRHPGWPISHPGITPDTYPAARVQGRCRGERRDTRVIFYASSPGPPWGPKRKRTGASGHRVAAGVNPRPAGPPAGRPGRAGVQTSPGRPGRPHERTVGRSDGYETASSGPTGPESPRQRGGSRSASPDASWSNKPMPLTGSKTPTVATPAAFNVESVSRA